VQADLNAKNSNFPFLCNEDNLYNYDLRYNTYIKKSNKYFYCKNTFIENTFIENTFIENTFIVFVEIILLLQNTFIAKILLLQK
jgi:hypothetical protein